MFRNPFNGDYHTGLVPHGDRPTAGTTNSVPQCKTESPASCSESQSQSNECSITTAQSSSTFPDLIDEEASLEIVDYTCIECSLAFKTLGLLHDHMATHRSNRPYACLECRSTFTRKDKLKRHLKIHDGSHYNQLSCRVCHKDFMSYQQLRSHTCGNQSYPRPPIIPTQSLTAVTSPDITSQSESTTPSMPRPQYKHPCAICGSSFKTPDRLKRHMLIHDPHKNFKCSLCPSAFKRNDKLKRHMTIHDPIKRFPCPWLDCTKAFNRSDKLKAHIMSHDKTVLAPYSSTSGVIPTSVPTSVATV